MSLVNNSFFDSVWSFASNHKVICVLTLGLALVGYSLGNLAGRAVSWIGECMGTTKKTDVLAREQIEQMEYERNAIRTREDEERELVELDQQPLETSNSLAQEVVPIASNEDNLPMDFFIQVLNTGKYSINGSTVIVPKAGEPTLVTFDSTCTLEQQLLQLKHDMVITNDQLRVSFEDQSTEEAINVRNDHFKIALNFANESHAGGGPGFHKDPISGSFVYDTQSARAQEESLCQRTNLMASLTALPHVLKKDSGHSKMTRSYYLDPTNPEKIHPFDSKKMAYVSDNHLFAVQKGTNFYESKYLEDNSQPVSFITSAAACYHQRQQIDCRKGSSVYSDARQRIETHLLAAAKKAAAIKESNSNQKVELILGAFGCGAFAPQGNPDEYRQMIADIYVELVPKFKGFFDLVTYAIPTFGSKDGRNAAVINHVIFKRALSV